jgi:bifunctional pyridoxal-dependent enzyme with beta-cystathionase and maltose regulon repressor activities
MQLVIAHKIGKSEAISIVKDKIHEFLTFGDEEVKNLKQHWNQNTLIFSFSSKGFMISGETTISDNLMSITLNLPFTLRLYESRLKSKLEVKMISILYKE